MLPSMCRLKTLRTVKLMRLSFCGLTLIYRFYSSLTTYANKTESPREKVSLKSF